MHRCARMRDEVFALQKAREQGGLKGTGCKRCPRTLTELVKSGYIAKVGAGPATGYVRI